MQIEMYGTKYEMITSRNIQLPRFKRGKEVKGRAGNLLRINKRAASAVAFNKNQ